MARALTAATALLALSASRPALAQPSPSAAPMPPAPIGAPAAPALAAPDAPPPPVATPLAPSSAVLQVVAPPCVERPYDRSRLLELLRVELAALGIARVVPVDGPAEATSLAPGVLATVVLSPPSCDPEGLEIALRVLDHATAKSVERRITLADVQLGERPRVLAIAVAELLSASLAEVQMVSTMPPRLEVGPVVRAALAQRFAPAIASARAESDARVASILADDERRKSDARTAERGRESEALLEAALLSRVFATRATATFGAGAGLRLKDAPWVFHLGADAGYGNIKITEGTVSLWTVSGSVGAGVATSGPVELEVSPRLSVGYVVATGSPDPDTAATEGNSVHGVTALAGLGASIRVHSESSWSPVARVEVGYAFPDVAFLSRTAGVGEDASERRVGGVGGPAIALTVGVGFGL